MSALPVMSFPQAGGSDLGDADIAGFEVGLTRHPTPSHRALRVVRSARHFSLPAAAATREAPDRAGGSDGPRSGSTSRVCPSMAAGALVATGPGRRRHARPHV